MTLQTAIERAIQGGWDKYEVKPEGQEIEIIVRMVLNNKKGDYEYPNTFLLDKNFWEALGKSMGWPDDHFNARCGTWKDEVTMEHCWLCWWKDFFIVFLANGGTIDRFFESLE